MSKFPKIPDTLNTSDNNLIKEFYEPCLTWAKRYDRGVGYFTSSWLKVNAQGMSIFATNGGKARWIASPIMSEEDVRAFKIRIHETEMIERYSNVLRDNIEQLKKYLEEETLNIFAWMLYDNIIEFKFAIPINDLEDGDFHDKFGIFYDEEGNRLSFNGSVNDSQKGMNNYESLKVFKSWDGLERFVGSDEQRFEKLWENKDVNVAIYEIPEAIKEDIFSLRSNKRPYKKHGASEQLNKWRHQEEAIKKFLAVGNGILEMATGTGKTRTAIGIINKLFEINEIESVIVTVNGTDLLDQWYKELMKHITTKPKVNRYYSNYKELSYFTLSPKNSVLLVSRDPDFLGQSIEFIHSKVKNKMLIICDEVHGIGSPALVNRLTDKIRPIKYRLGLSATPEREYDESGNDFITNEIGEVIYKFGLEDAIKRGILCEFDYIPIEYELTQEDRLEIKGLIAVHNVKRKNGQHVDDNELYRNIARVKKVSLAKIPLFKSQLEKNQDILKRAIIFVETKEFGIHVQNILINYIHDYHTYYGEDDRNNLTLFSRGELSCLVTSKRISEGIDISSVNNIILCSADRARIQTIQRIGRSLRIDPKNPDKRACVIDFICINRNLEDDEEETNEELNADQQRSLWLSDLSKTRRED